MSLGQELRGYPHWQCLSWPILNSSCPRIAAGGSGWCTDVLKPLVSLASPPHTMFSLLTVT